MSDYDPGRFSMLDDEREREDRAAGIAPFVDSLGSRIASDLNSDPDFIAWSKAHVYFTAPSGARLEGDALAEYLAEFKEESA